MATITHKLFLDDSGNKEYSPDGTYAATGGRTPYFVFGGLLVRPEIAGVLSAAMESLKIEAFGNPDVEVKATWLKRPAERKKWYLDRYPTSDEKIDALVTGVYNLIANTNCELIACVVNKAEVQREYGDRAYYAPAIAYECVVQRAQHAMESCGGRVHVTIDDMEGKSPKGSEWKLNLKRHHRSLRKRGSQLIRGMALDRLFGDEPAFRDSAHDHRVQLADLVAHCVYRQFVDHGPDWEAPQGEDLPMYEYFEKIHRRFRNHDGRVQGYGIVKFPMKNRVRWKIEDK